MTNVLEKITELREKRNWTEYQLAEQSGLTQSTISSWYRKGMLPTIPSLIKICDAFDITLSQFFSDDEAEYCLLNAKQLQLIELTKKLNSEQFIALLSLMEKL